MNFKVKNFSTIRIVTNDIAQSKEWYSAFFNQMPVEDSENFVSFDVANVLFDITKADAKNPFSTGGSIGYWLVDDLNGAIEKAYSLGGKVYRGPLEVKEIGRTIVQIQDPFGNIIGLEAYLKMDT